MPQSVTPSGTSASTESERPQAAVDFVYRIEGDNQLELSELIPILTSLGELIQEGNRVAYPDLPDIAISVKPFEEGSFEIELLLSPGAMGTLFTFIQAGGVQKIAEVLSNIGLVATNAKTAYTSLLELYKKLKGEQPKEIKEVEKGIRYEVTTQDGDILQINGPVQNMYQSSVIAQNLTLVYNEPLRKATRKKVQSYIKSERKETLVEFTQEDMPALLEAKPLELLQSSQTEQEVEHTNVVFLRPKRGSFEGESSKWSFRKGGRQGEILQVNIKDQDFLNKLESGEYRLSANDVLKVELKERQKLVGSDLRTTNEIVKVLEYNPAPPSACRQALISNGMAVRTRNSPCADGAEHARLVLTTPKAGAARSLGQCSARYQIIAENERTRIGCDVSQGAGRAQVDLPTKLLTKTARPAGSGPINH
jgi:hypothetical protein